MSRWTAPSSDDYYASVECRQHDYAVLHCIKCERPVTVDADEPGPVFCAKCAAVDDARQAAARRGVA